MLMNIGKELNRGEDVLTESDTDRILYLLSKSTTIISIDFAIIY